MATKKKIVQIKDMTSLAKKLQSKIKAALKTSKQLNKEGMVQIGKVKEGRNISVITVSVGGKQFKSRTGDPIEPMLYAWEYGARPHTIFPRSPKTKLKFYWAKLGKTVAPPYVNHPGMMGKGKVSAAILEASFEMTPELAEKVRANIIDSLNFEIEKINAKR